MDFLFAITSALRGILGPTDPPRWPCNTFSVCFGASNTFFISLRSAPQLLSMASLTSTMIVDIFYIHLAVFVGRALERQWSFVV
jgi:hypothetical protein